LKKPTYFLSFVLCSPARAWPTACEKLKPKLRETHLAQKPKTDGSTQLQPIASESTNIDLLFRPKHPTMSSSYHHTSKESSPHLPGGKPSDAFSWRSSTNDELEETASALLSLCQLTADLVIYDDEEGSEKQTAQKRKAEIELMGEDKRQVVQVTVADHEPSETHSTQKRKAEEELMGENKRLSVEVNFVDDSDVWHRPTYSRYTEFLKQARPCLLSVDGELVQVLPSEKENRTIRFDESTSVMEIENRFTMAALAGLKEPISFRRKSKCATRQPPKGTFESNLIVVLDLDECLVHALRKEIEDEQNLNSHNACDSFCITMLGAGGAGAEVQCLIRPGLHTFLNTVCQKYETHIFTAAREEVARPIVQKLQRRAQCKFSSTWYRQHCTVHPATTGKGKIYVKDLEKLGFPLDRTILVDNNPRSFQSQPDNGLLVKSFYGDARDDTLGAVVEMLATAHEEIFAREQSDVRLFLKKQGFGSLRLLQRIRR
jgi:Dullard-like phosphatase family protein